jgi:uncharacterized protein
MTFKLALVTGASSGIGEALCRLLAAKGIDLLITGRNQKALDALAESLHSLVQVTVMPLDLAVTAERDQLYAAIHRQIPDLVINNAGFGLYGDAVTLTTEEQSQIVEVNCQALTEIAIEAVRTLASAGKRGVILNVSSSAGFLPFPKFAVYAASKAYVNNLSEALDNELKPSGIRVLAACPGMVATRFGERASHGSKKPRSESEKASTSALVMTPSYAAEQIWQQIEKGRPIQIFNGYYRFLTFLARFLVPRPLLMALLRKEIATRRPDQPIIKPTDKETPHDNKF